MRVLVTGGTGFIGSRVVGRLLAGGHEVRVLVRRPEAVSRLPDGVVAVHGHVGDAAALLEGMRGCDAVVDLAACYRFWTLDPGEYERVNVEGTRTVMESVLAAGVPKVVHVSSLVVYGGGARGRIDEGAEETSRPLSRYAATKQRGDRIIWGLHRTAGLPVTVVYPGAVLGESDPKASGDYVRRLVRRQLPFAVFADVPFPWVDVRDVAEISIRAAERPGTVGQRYFAVAESVTFAAFNRLVEEIAGVPAPRLRLPAPLVVASAAALTAVAGVVRRPPLMGMAVEQMRTMRAGLDADGRRATRDLGVTYTPLRTVLERVIRGILDEGRRPVARAATTA